VLLAEGRLDEADRLFQSTLSARQRADEEDTAAETRMNLALVRIEEGRPAEGLALARLSTQAFQAMHQSGNTALALAIGALAEVALHENAAAAADCERARTAIAGNRQNQPHLFVLLAEARVEAASGHLGEARALAEAARARAEKARSLASVFEARLVLGEIDVREHPEADVGVKRLQALAREAKAKSFFLIARKAEGLVASMRGGDAAAYHRDAEQPQDGCEGDQPPVRQRGDHRRRCRDHLHVFARLRGAGAKAEHAAHAGGGH
jgi:hypothetical protein